MARIPPAELERLKSEISVEQLARARGVKLEKKGKDLHGLCCFHEEKTASLVISPEKNLWNCFGCNEGGDVIAWVMKAEGVSFRHAVELLRVEQPETSTGPVRPRKRSTSRKLPKLASTDLEDQALLGRVVSFYHQTLKETTEAHEFLTKRGLADSRLVEHFKLGFANRTLGYRLPSRDSEEGQALRDRLQALGVIRKTGHEHLRGSLVVPLFDEQGQVVQLYGRKVARVKGSNHLYLSGPQRGVFNREALCHSEEIILCESIVDAMTFWSAGIRNVTTTYGAGGLHEDLREALRKSGTKRVLIAYDRDAAGEKGAEKVAAELTAAGIAAYRILFPRGMDANEYAAKVTPANRSLALVVRHAEWMGEGQEPERGELVDPDHQEVALEEQVAEEVSAPSDEARSARAEVPAASQARTCEREEAAKEEGGDGALAEIPETSPPDPASEPSEPLPPEPILPSLAALPTPASESEPAPVYRVPPSEVALELTRHGEEQRCVLGDRHYRIRGLMKNLGEGAMRVNLRVTREETRNLPTGAGFHLDTLDLNISRPREAFARKAARELGVEEVTIHRDLGVLLDLLETAQMEELRSDKEQKTQVPEMTDFEREEALELLRDPDLLGRILEDYRRCGVVGEETNKLVGYVAAISRKLSAPLAVVIQSASAAGKSLLQDAVLQFVPREERVCYSAMTGQSLFYMSETDLKHKVLAIAEEEGAQRASYALKLLQSEGELTIASTGKDATSGRLTTHEYHVEGPVMIFLTTTAIDMDEELLNRCLVLTVDEGREQTRAIHKLQRDRQTLDGVFEDEEREDIVRTHRNAQRLLRPLRVVNPYAHELTFLDHQTRCRRDHTKYLTLIQAITLLHQYQREVKTERRGKKEVTYVEASREDIAMANRLLSEVLERSMDELPPQTRRLLGGITEMVEARCQEEGVTRDVLRFTRRDVRQWTGVGNTQAKVHLKRLEDLEYLLVHTGGRGQSLVYELLVPDGEATDLPGSTEYGSKWSWQEGEKSGPSQPQVGPKSGGCRPSDRPPESQDQSQSEPDTRPRNPGSLQKALIGTSKPGNRTVAGRRSRAARGNGSRPPAD